MKLTGESRILIKRKKQFKYILFVRNRSFQVKEYIFFKKLVLIALCLLYLPTKVFTDDYYLKCK